MRTGRNCFGGRRIAASLFLAISFLVWCDCTWATVYYVANSGSDTNDGLTTLTPWQTIAKVDNFTFTPGDSILFKRGDTWRAEKLIVQNGSPTASITYGAYGTGNKPQFLDSVQKNNASESPWR